MLNKFDFTWQLHFILRDFPEHYMAKKCEAASRLGQKEGYGWLAMFSIALREKVQNGKLGGKLIPW